MAEPAVRPRFTDDDIRILLAAMFVYSRREKNDPAVQAMYARIEHLSESLDDRRAPSGGRA